MSWPGFDNQTQPAGKLLEQVFTSFARDAEVSLSAYLHSSVSLRFTETEPISGADLQRNRMGPICSASVQWPSQSKRLLIELSRPTTYQMIEILLGGKPLSPPALDREPTEIEKHLMLMLFQRLLTDLEKAFSASVPVRMNLARLESTFSWRQAIHSIDELILARFSCAIAEQSGDLRIVVPNELGEWVLETLDEARSGSEAVSPDHISLTLDRLSTASVSVETWVEGWNMSVVDLFNLREGQVVLLDGPIDRNVVSTLNGKPCFTGQIVNAGNKRAFLIEEVVRPEKS